MKLLIDAGPGSGKTTTLINGLKYLLTGNCNNIIPTQEQINIFYLLKKELPAVSPSEIVFIAFNKAIQQQTAKLLPHSVSSYTFNGLGQSIVFKKHRFQKLDRTRGEKLISFLTGKAWQTLPFPVKREYTLLLRFISHMKEELLSPSESSLAFIQDKYGYQSAPSDILMMEKLMKIMSVPNKQTTSSLENCIEYIDQVWMGLINIDRPRYKIAFIDECQDMSVLRTEFSLRIAEHQIYCGDGCQSINGFNGADYTVFDKLHKICNHTLPLKTCFRCPPNHIESANNIRPARIIPFKKDNGPIERVTTTALPQRIKGLLEESTTWGIYKKPVLNEEPILIIARTNASLVSLGLILLKHKIRATIIKRSDEDQDITSMVSAYIKSSKATDVPSLINTCKKDIERSNKLEFKVGARLNDIASCVLHFAKEVNTINQIDNLLQILTEETTRTIRLSTIHKAKGLEAPIVFIAFPPIRHPRATSLQDIEQEKNLEFVSETRSQWYKGYIVHE